MGFLLVNLENNSFQGPNRTNYLRGKQQMIMLLKQTWEKKFGLIKLPNVDFL
jgi:hypothetical protein